ncbi:MAG: hypothetical protein AB7O24_21410 [Kofleriaceae bacterium]
MTARALHCALWLGLALIAAGCKEKSKTPPPPPPEITGLAAVPASALAVIGADVAKLGESEIAERAITDLLVRERGLSEKWQHLQSVCKLDLLHKIDHVMLAVGPPPPDAPHGTGPALLVAIGKLVETDLAACVRTLVGNGGGTLTATASNGRTVYVAKDGNRALYFAFSRADTLVLANQEAYLIEAISGGKKAPDSEALKELLAMVDQRSPLWFAGRLPPRVSGGLIAVVPGLKAGPSSVVGTVDLTRGAKVELGAVMSTEPDAKTLESFTNDQMKLVGGFAQFRSLGPLVNKIKVAANDKVVRFGVELTTEEVNQLLSVLDAGPQPKQGSPPAQGSGTPPGPH